jgi:O-methyltransferase involved in polyketide biosynthesis
VAALLDRLATKSELVEDRFAEPLVRAVGIDFFDFEHRHLTGTMIYIADGRSFAR